MKTHGLPEEFWVVTRPSQFSTSEDILFPCTFERLMLQTLGGLQEDEIVGIFAEETEARRSAATLLGKCPVRPQDAVFVEVVVNVMVKPNDEEMTARELARSAVEAVADAVRRGEKAGFQHGLAGRICLGISEVVELRNLTTVRG
jgi:hypothetical protein